jgi:predicted permease
MPGWNDLRLSARSFARTPGLTLTLLLTIALGIGSNASVAGFARGLVTRHLPIPGIDSVVSVFGRDAQDAFGPVSYDTYASLEAQRETFEWLGAARESRVGVVLVGRSSVMSVAAVTPRLAELFQLPLGEGVVISHRVWQSESGTETDASGTSIRIDGVETRVAGVAPDWLSGLYLGSDVDIWMRLDERRGQEADRTSRTFWAFGQLRPGVSMNRAQAIVNAPRSGGDMIAVLRYSGMTPEGAAGMSRIGTLLPAAAGAVFLIACANVATFLLARASARSHETSVRVALGASRAQLAKQLLADGVLISAVGAAFGALLAAWTSRVIPALLFDRDAEQLVFVPNVAGIVAASAACALMTVACGLLPLFEIRHDEPASVLRRETLGSSGAMRRIRTVLVVGQMACCCLLVVSSALLLSSFRSALQTSVGNRLQQSILATIESRHRFSRPDLGLEYFQAAEQTARSLPGISATAWSGTPPGSRPAWQSVRIEPPELPLRDVKIDVEAFTPETLDLVKLPPVAGRMFGGADTRDTCPVVIVNEEAAQEFFGGDAVGRAIEDPAGQRVEIVGVVAARDAEDARATRRPTIYYYGAQNSTPLDRTGPARFRVGVLPQKGARAVLEANVISQSYFYTMGLSPIAGALFADDPAPHSCRVGVINQEAAGRYFNGRAVGGALIDGAGNRTTIVGVVHAPLLRTSQRRIEPAVYFPMAQDYRPRMTLMLDARESSERTLTAVRRALDLVPGGLSGSVVTTLEEHLSRTVLAPDRIATILVGAAAATALLLGVLGLYGAMSEATRQRRREIAVRLALGAQGWRVVRQVLAEGIRLAGTGTAAGMLGSVLIGRWLSRVTPSAGTAPLWVWLAAPLLLMFSVAIASVVPARRAAAVDPLSIMRDA